MIRIEDFLFIENIEQSLSESLLTIYGNLSFNNIDDFYKYFESQNINLIKSSNTIIVEQQSLLQRFKDFKKSSDYKLVKTYIINQKKIQDAINSNNLNDAKNLLESISVTNVDPFFNFVVRRILTGSESGILPSENLQQLLNNQLKSSQQDINTDIDVVRDEYGTIQSFKNYLKNKGSLKINVLDDRFLIDSFDHIVDNSFKSLIDAVNAESNILKKANELINIGTDAGKLTEDLKKLILQENNTIPALQSKIEVLEEKIDGLEELVDTKTESIDDLVRVIEELSDKRNILVNDIETKDKTIIELNQTIDSTLTKLQDNLSNQLKNNEDAFDSLSSKLEQQAKNAEENSAKQLEAFKSAMGSLTSGLQTALSKEQEIVKSKDDTPEEKRKKEKIKQIQDKWDNIKYISTKNDDDLELILKKVGSSIGISRIKFVDLSGNLASRVNQVYSWNSQYKSQFKSLMNLSNIKTEKDADEILILVDKLKTTPEMEKPVRTFLYDSFDGDVFDKWRNDSGESRGVNAPKVQDISGLIGAKYVFDFDKKDFNTTDIENKLKASSFDTIIEVLGLVNEFASHNY